MEIDSHPPIPHLPHSSTRPQQPGGSEPDFISKAQKTTTNPRPSHRAQQKIGLDAGGTTYLSSSPAQLLQLCISQVLQPGGEHRERGSALCAPEPAGVPQQQPLSKGKSEGCCYPRPQKPKPEKMTKKSTFSMQFALTQRFGLYLFCSIKKIVLIIHLVGRFVYSHSYNRCSSCDS